MLSSAIEARDRLPTSLELMPDDPYRSLVCWCARTTGSAGRNAATEFLLNSCGRIGCVAGRS